MNKSLGTILERLDEIAVYSGPWRPLRDEAGLLRSRVSELRERETRLDDLLVVALIGGSGVGKSTLLNALAGDEVAPMSEFRPCTSTPTVYHPPGARLPFEEGRRVSRSALEQLVIIDTPDSDTVVRDHRDAVIRVLAYCDLILICGSPEKYLDEATWSLLRPLQGERTMVCVETKAGHGTASIREHWVGKLRGQGFDVDRYFRVNALHALDRKLRGGVAGEDECDFTHLEEFLRDELTNERTRWIKRSNALGLLRKTLTTLEERIGSRVDALTALQGQVDVRNRETMNAAFDLIRRRLFTEPHLWSHALGRETAHRAKGIVGMAYRVLEAIRGLPLRIAGPLAHMARLGVGRRAAALLAEGPSGEDDSERPADFGVLGDEIGRLYLDERSRVALEFAQAGFDSKPEDAGLAEFQGDVQRRLAGVLRGPVRDRVGACARTLTSWPATLLQDALPLAFLVFTAYHVVREFFSSSLLSGAFFVHALAVLAIILAAELLVISLLVRILAWGVRKRATLDLRRALLESSAAFVPQREALDVALRIAAEMRELGDAVKADEPLSEPAS